MLQHAGKKKPAGDTTPPTSCTDSADFTSSAIVSFVAGLAYAGAGHGTIRVKAKAPVTQKHLVRSGCSPHREAGFCHAQILGAGAPVALAQWLRGVVGPTRKDGRTASDVFLTTTPHPLHSKMQTVALVTPEGAKTMHPATPAASASARTPTTNAPTEEERAYALLQALSSASLARLYLHKNNVPAARRQAVLLLKTLQTLEAA